MSDAIDKRFPADTSSEPPRLADKLRAHVPMLAGEPVVIDSSSVRDSVLGFCDDFGTGEAGEPAGRLGQILARGEIDAGSLLAASIGRQQEAIRTQAHYVGVEPDLLWLVAELTAAPITNRLQKALTVEVAASHPALQSLVSEWDRGFCGVCGSWPAFGEHTGGAGSGRDLRCSFCGSAWHRTGRECIYCTGGDEFLIAAAVEPDQPSRRLEFCRQCGGYLKCLDVERSTPFELLAVEDLGSHDLDLGAAERGYSRPPMRTFVTPDDTPCPPVSVK